MTVVNGSQLIAAAPIRDMLTTKERLHGVSYGLAEAGYDIRIKQDIQFIPAGKHLYVPIAEEGPKVGFRRQLITEQSVAVVDNPATPEWSHEIKPGRFTIASAIEEFQMPTNLVGVVHDKSTWARRGLSVFNTVLEPGWKGFLTLELVYHGQDVLHIPAGAGIAQILFSRIETEGRYTGKYQNQADRPVEAIYEKG